MLLRSFRERLGHPHRLKDLLEQGIDRLGRQPGEAELVDVQRGRMAVIEDERVAKLMVRPEDARVGATRVIHLGCAGRMRDRPPAEMCAGSIKQNAGAYSHA
eukprot:685121-Pleurochrysis_carterae.AAC.1